MKKIALTFALYATIMAQAMSYAAAPSRTYNYSSGTTISSSQVNTNELALYTYLQNGVDTLASGAVADVNVASNAAIQYSKLNVAGQIKNSDIVASAGIPYSKLTLTNSVVDGDIVSITTAGKVSGTALTGLASTPSGAGALPIANGGTGQITAQAAIDALTNVSAATNEYVLTKDTSTGNAIFKVTAPTTGYSNVLFQWLGNSTPSVIATLTASANSFTSSNLISKFIKTSGVSTVTVYISASALGDGTDQKQCKVVIGSVSGLVSVPKDLAIAWYSFTIDVSSLSNSTAYDVDVQLKAYEAGRKISWKTKTRAER